MSSTAPQIRRLSAAAPRIAQAALDRARLTVVPPRRSQAPRLPFITFVSIILLAGVVGLLLFNTSMQQASFRETALRKQATNLAVKQEALEMELAALGQSERIARAAQRLGMVIPSTPAGVLHLGTGEITGKPTPAVGSDTIPLSPPGPSKPGDLNPKTVKVKVRAEATAPTTERRVERRAGQQNRDTQGQTGRNAERDGAPSANR